MKIIICIEYAINLILSLYFYMHMFQLNSYKLNKNFNWIKSNIKKFIIQILILIFCTALTLIQKTILDIIVIMILAILIIYNFPKKQAKVKFEITNRVKRMFLTQLILIVLFFCIGGIKNYIIIKFGIINIIAFSLCIIANIINMPIENIGKKIYIKQAKKIIKQMPNLIVIGVTGSYGKTSVKNFLSKILSKKYEVLVTPKNYNTTMGVVKTIRENLKSTHQIFICEMGATKKGDIKLICDIVKPKIGIITSIGPQHLETFKNIENIIQTKFELYDAIKENDGKIFLNYDNEYISKMEKKNNMYSYGINNSQLDYNSYNINSCPKGLKFTMKDKNTKEENEFETKLIGKHNVVNLTGAIGVANLLGISFKEIKTCIKKIENVEHRMKVISNGNISIIDNSYNSNPISSKSALDTLSEFEGTKIIVTPGLIELGDKQDKYNYEFGQYIAKICDYIYLVGKKSTKPVLKGIQSKNFNKERIFIVNSPQESLESIKKSNIEGKITVLLENDLPDNYNM